MQSLLAEMRSSEQVDRVRDLYLVFVLPEIPDGRVSDLQLIANDSYVCRKIVLEQRDRSLSEVVAELPIFCPPSKANDARSIDRAAEDLGVPGEILNDLARRSPSVVLDRLLRGEYAEEETSEA